MKSIGKYNIYLRGSRKSVERYVYEDSGRTFVIWYKQLIEVKRGRNDYYTIELY